MTFLIIYGILAAISFVVFCVLTEIVVKEENSVFITNVYRTNYLKVLLVALFWPLTWVAAIIHAIVVSKE